MTKRYTVTVTDTQAEWLEEIAAHDEVSVSHVVRDALRNSLPRLVELNRFLADPRSMSHDEVLSVVGSLDNLHDLILPEDSGSGGVVADDVALPPRRKRRASPPSSNTGANSTKNPGNTGK